MKKVSAKEVSMKKVSAKEVRDSIKKDLEKGVFNNFPVVKSRLESILIKLTNLSYIVNSEPISRLQVKTLIENSYISSEFEFTDPSKIFDL